MVQSNNDDLVQQWLEWQSTDLANGLESIEDAGKLYLYWKTTKGLPEFADTDEWVDEDTGLKINLAHHRVKALGYDPLNNQYPK